MKTLAALVAVLILVAGSPRAQAPAASPTTVRIGVLKGGSYEVVTLPLEEYVARVLAGEALPGSAPAAMEALAVAVRTYTQIGLGKHRAEGFDLCDQTHCQVMRTASATTDRAAQATAGQILVYRGAPATIYYSASCGGRTEIPSAVWPGAEDPPYLPSQSDDGCDGGPVWTAELALSDLRRSFAAAGFAGTLREMSISSRDRSGRVAKLKLEGLTPPEISGQDLRAAVGRTLGWQYVRSAAFEMRRSGDIYRMDGRGSGHGVGMCVIGAAKWAETGKSATDILTHYYPGVEIGRFAPRLTAVPTAVPTTASAPAAAGTPATTRSTAVSPAAPVMLAGIVISLPEGDEGERAMLTTLTGRERDALAKVLGVTAPERVAVRVHPTTDDYQRATGRPWFTYGAVVNGEIHLPPLAPMRDSGLLERMVRRQVVHLLTDEVLRQRPAWVREGAASYYSESETASSAALARASCPSNVDLERPISAGALSTAYAEARGCFERQIAAGRGWRDIR